MKLPVFVAAAVAGLITVPILNVSGSVFAEAEAGIWEHLFRTVLVDYVVNSVLLVVLVAAIACLLAVPAAWFTAACEFRLKTAFVWLLPLPLAMPAYIIAYTYTGVLDYAGPVQSMLRDLAGWSRNDYWFFEIRSVGGAAAMLGFVLYPYVYLLARAAFLQSSLRALDVSRTLGRGGIRSFIGVSLPLARPAIAIGVALVLMETLADYGTVQYFGVSTFTTGIFRSFYGFGAPVVALQLSAMLLGLVALLIYVERLSRRRARFDNRFDAADSSRIRLSGGAEAIALLACSIPVLLGFIVPVLILLKYSVFDSNWALAANFKIVWNSFSLAGLAALISVSLALFVGFAERTNPGRLIRAAAGLSGLGYAVPGTIVAVGILSPLIWVDRQIIALAGSVFGQNVGLLLTGSTAALLYAYSVRFMAISLGSIRAGMEKISPTLDHSARSLGQRPRQILLKVHLPLLRSSILASLLLVFVDALKELPATLILRPFNFTTLAVRAYELASDERLADAAAPSILIVLVGIVPVILLTRNLGRR